MPMNVNVQASNAIQNKGREMESRKGNRATVA